jgi:predicted peptidase
MHRNILISLVLGIMAIQVSKGAEPAAGKQVEQELSVDGAKVRYLLYLPKEYGSKEKVPLMLFLHGRGESQPPLSNVAKWGPPRQLARGEHLPYIVVSPQCPTNESWGQPGQQKLLVKLLDQVTEKYKVDQSKIYLTGLSMGGYGSWRLAADHPERFAAVVPICGGGRAEDAEKLKELPIWVWHGTEDTAVPLARSTEMVEAIRKAGGTRVRFTVLEHIGHVSWEAAYTAPDLYQWLDQQVRK